LAKREVKQADDVDLSPFDRILVVGPTGSGKSALIRTLPGKKFVFVFDPNTMRTLAGTPNMAYVEFLPEFENLDTSLKGFNQGAKSDKHLGKKNVEPLLYEEWREYFNQWVSDKEYEKYDWMCFDSFTFISRAMMERQLFINNRYGEVEDRADLKIVGAKISDVFSNINGLPINVFCTAHVSNYEDEKTKKVHTALYLPGRARTVLPLTFTNIWEAQAGDKPGEWEVKTLPERKGLQEIRTSLKNLKPVEDVTIRDFRKAEEYGVGALLKRSISGGTTEKRKA
jgi:GTPase SAR1 family protein